MLSPRVRAHTMLRDSFVRSPKKPFVFTGPVPSFPLLANPKGEVARTDRGDQARPGSACSSASRRPRVENRRRVLGRRGTNAGAAERVIGARCGALGGFGGALRGPHDEKRSDCEQKGGKQNKTARILNKRREKKSRKKEIEGIEGIVQRRQFS